ncbi:MAG: sulfotransferase [Alphaproteobacteria bacterium]|nr:sulfotransferase [Alphaproteobacteria bacterium]
MPDNFCYVGLIHLILPQAIILHCRRDALDTCLSCYRTHFAEGNAWSYELAELGRRYRLYAETMWHWNAVLPGRVYDVHYESLVANPEHAIRDLLNHCGLPWAAACLVFHRNKGRVATASAVQVRQPLHAGSIGRAEPYRP